MSTLKKLKSLFIIEEEGPEPNKEKTADKKESDNKSQKPKPKPVPKPSIALDPNVKGKVDPRFTNTLLKAIEANNLDGFDYLEFKQALKNMSKIEPDESKAFQAAFITAQTLGVTPGKLADSARFYIDILKKEENKFNQALQQQQSTNVTQREEQLKKLQSDIKTKTEKVNALQAEIKAHEGKLEKLKGEVDSYANKIMVTKSNFDASFVALKQQLETDIDKMEKYLK
ncbi:MAG: hypothetical protein AAF502_02050 [Bacteroidota bacterium]